MRPVPLGNNLLALASLGRLGKTWAPGGALARQWRPDSRKDTKPRQAISHHSPSPWAISQPDDPGSLGCFFFFVHFPLAPRCPGSGTGINLALGLFKLPVEVRGHFTFLVALATISCHQISAPFCIARKGFLLPVLVTVLDPGLSLPLPRIRHTPFPSRHSPAV